MFHVPAAQAATRATVPVDELYRWPWPSWILAQKGVDV